MEQPMSDVAMEKTDSLKVLSLNKDHISEVTELLSHKKTTLKNPILYDSVMLIVKDIESPNYKLYGVFHNDKIIAVTGVFLWTKMPFYTISELFINTQHSVEKYNRIINISIDKITSEMEALGRYEFYVLTLVRSFQKRILMEKKMWKVNKKYTPFQRYDVSLETIIKAGETPQFETYWSLMGKKTWPSDLWIRKYRLKNELILQIANWY